MINYQKKLSVSKQEGNDTENHFQRLVLNKGRNCIKSSKQDDIYNHIDFYIDGTPVDVKGNRHLNCIWLELTNVNGKDGWLKGKSKYIVLDIKELNSFCFFLRSDLLEFCSQFYQKTTNKKDFYKIYTRSKFGRKDELIKVKFLDIKHLLKGKLKYENISY